MLLLSHTLQVVEYNNANREVAILCNHQRTVSGAMQKNFENLQERLDTIKAQRNELKQWKKLLEEGKGKKIPLKGAKKDGDDEDPDEQVTLLSTLLTSRPYSCKQYVYINLQCFHL
jgi:Eukaryotic DNA topoisomerase I, catalytic core